MKYLPASLLALAAIVLPSLHNSVQAQGIKTLPLSACHVLDGRDFAAAGVPPPQLLANFADNVRACQFVYGAPPHILGVTVRTIAQLGRSDVLQPNVCNSAAAQARPGQSCTPVSGYGKFGALLKGMGSGGEGAALIFQTSRYQIAISAMGVPGGSATAVQRLGKILASRYH